MEFESFFPVLALIVGLCLGSFYNVCIHRYVSGQSIVLPGSHCPGCGHILSWWENIPLISYVLLLGRCRSCRQGISPVYPVVESLSGILALFLALKFGFGLEWLAYMLFFGLLIVASFIDLKIYILPDIITLPGALLAFGASFILPVFWLDALLGALLGAGLFWSLQWAYRTFKKVEGLGTGDIKLMLMLGALVGWQGLPIQIFAAALTGLAASLIYMKKTPGGGMQTPIPFGPFLALGAVIYILAGENIWTWYLGG